MPKHVYILITVFCLGGIFFIFTTQGNRKKEENAFLKLIPQEYRSSVHLSRDNPFTEEKASIGRYLFYDRRLSFNQTRSCASCHDPAFSFTDGYRRSVGALGDLHQRNSSPLINLVFNKHLTAADPSLLFPEEQISNPMFRVNPIELGWKGNEVMILKRLKEDPFYKAKMKLAFPNDEDPFTVKNIQYSLASFVKTIVSLNAPYDQYKENQRELSELEEQGMALFFSSRLNCSKCHGGINFSTPSVNDSDGDTIHYFNTGLYNLNGTGDYPAYDQGLYEKTSDKSDKGKFRVPTLRNLTFTAPYFHDGSAETLDEVINVYEEGGRNKLTGSLKGDGRKNPFKHPLIIGFNLTAIERKALISFLFSLSDSSIIKNQSYSNPFTQDETKK